MEGRKWLAAVLVMLLVVAGCGGDGTSPAQGGQASTKATSIGPNGGKASASDGRLIARVPEGALGEKVDIKVTEEPNAPPGHIGPAYRFEPEGQKFDAYVALEFHLDEKNIDERFPRLLVAREEGGQWVPVEMGWRRAADGIVTGLTRSFSVYGVVPAVEPPPGPCECEDAEWDACCEANGFVSNVAACECGPRNVRLWDKVICAADWTDFQSDFWKLQDCYGRVKGDRYQDLYDLGRCSGAWAECCKQAGGAGEAWASSIQEYESGKAPGCICELGCGPEPPGAQAAVFERCLGRAVKDGKALVHDNPVCAEPTGAAVSASDAGAATDGGGSSGTGGTSGSGGTGGTGGACACDVDPVCESGCGCDPDCKSTRDAGSDAGAGCTSPTDCPTGQGCKAGECCATCGCVNLSGPYTVAGTCPAAFFCTFAQSGCDLSTACASCTGTVSGDDASMTCSASGITGTCTGHWDGSTVAGSCTSMAGSCTFSLTPRSGECVLGEWGPNGCQSGGGTCPADQPAKVGCDSREDQPICCPAD